MTTTSRLFASLATFCLVATWLGVCQSYPDHYRQLVRNGWYSGEQYHIRQPRNAYIEDTHDVFVKDVEADEIHRDPQAALVRRGVQEEKDLAALHEEMEGSGDTSDPALTQDTTGRPARSCIHKFFKRPAPVATTLAVSSANSLAANPPVIASASSAASSAASAGPGAGASAAASASASAVGPRINYGGYRSGAVEAPCSIRERKLLLRQQALSLFQDLFAEVSLLRSIISVIFSNLKSEFSLWHANHHHCREEVAVSTSTYAEASSELSSLLRRGPKILELVLNEPEHLLSIPEIIVAAVPAEQIVESLHRLKNTIIGILKVVKAWLSLHEIGVDFEGLLEIGALLEKHLSEGELRKFEILESIASPIAPDTALRLNDEPEDDAIINKLKTFQDLLNSLRDIPTIFNDLVDTLTDAVSGLESESPESSIPDDDSSSGLPLSNRGPGFAPGSGGDVSGPETRASLEDTGIVPLSSPGFSASSAASASGFWGPSGAVPFGSPSGGSASAAASSSSSGSWGPGGPVPLNGSPGGSSSAASSSSSSGSWGPAGPVPLNGSPGGSSSAASSSSSSGSWGPSGTVPLGGSSSAASSSSSSGSWGPSEPSSSSSAAASSSSSGSWGPSEQGPQINPLIGSSAPPSSVFLTNPPIGISADAASSSASGPWGPSSASSAASASVSSGPWGPNGPIIIPSPRVTNINNPWPAGSVGAGSGASSGSPGSYSGYSAQHGPLPLVLPRSKLCEVIGTNQIGVGEVITINLPNNIALIGTVVDSVSPIGFSFLNTVPDIRSGTKIWNINAQDFHDNECARALQQVLRHRC